MSGIRRYDELIPDVVIGTKATEGICLRELRNAGREFCRRTTLWREELPSIDIRTPITSWTCDNATSHTGHFDAEADTNLIGVGSKITISLVAYTISAMTSNGDQTGEVTLSAQPTDIVADEEAEITQITKTNGWQVIDPREFVLTERANAIIERLTKLRLVLSSGSATYSDYYEDDGVYRFITPLTVLISKNISVEYEILDALTFTAMLVPTPQTSEVPAWLLNDWGEGLVAWAIAKIKAMPGPFLDDKWIRFWQDKYNEKLNEALIKADEAWGIGR